MTDTKTVTIRVTASKREIDALVCEWLDEAHPALNIVPAHAPHEAMTVRLSYVKEQK